MNFQRWAPTTSAGSLRTLHTPLSLPRGPAPMPPLLSLEDALARCAVLDALCSQKLAANARNEGMVYRDSESNADTASFAVLSGSVESSVRGDSRPWCIKKVLEVDMESERKAEKRTKRLLSNRKSAKRARVRKHERLQDMEELSMKLRAERDETLQKLEEAEAKLECCKQRNAELLSQADDFRKLAAMGGEEEDQRCSGYTIEDNDRGPGTATGDFEPRGAVCTSANMPSLSASMEEFCNAEVVSSIKEGALDSLNLSLTAHTSRITPREMFSNMAGSSHNSSVCHSNARALEAQTLSSDTGTIGGIDKSETGGFMQHIEDDFDFMASLRALLER